MTGSLVLRFVAFGEKSRGRAARGADPGSAAAMPLHGERLPLAGRRTNIGKRGDERCQERSGELRRGEVAIVGRERNRNEPFAGRRPEWPGRAASAAVFFAFDIASQVARCAASGDSPRHPVLHQAGGERRACPPSRGAPSFDPAPVQIERPRHAEGA
jgi:hypothetical protein